MRALLLLLALPSCIPLAVGVGAVGLRNAGDVARLQDRVAVNAWTDAAVVQQRTAIVVDGEGDLEALLAPPWSYGGVSVRIASTGRSDVLYLPELQVVAYSQSGVTLTARLGDELLRAAAKDRYDWRRFPLTREQNDAMLAGGAVVTVECEVGSWTFRMPPSYFAGFHARIASSHYRTCEAMAPID